MKNIDATIQYLHWALIAAHMEAHPDCEQVNVKLDLEQRQSTTSYVPKNAPDEGTVNSVLLNVAEIVHTALTGPEKFNRQGCINLLAKAIKLARERGVRVPKTLTIPG